MPCCLIVLSLCLPRLVLFCMWAFGSYLNVYETSICPLLGFVFAPYTTLAYAAAMHHGGVKGEWLVILIVGVILDLGNSSATVTSKKGD